MNAGITNIDKIYFTKTVTTRVASEQIGKDLFRRVHNVVFTEKSGNTIEVITVSDASSEECPMGAFDVYQVKNHFGGKS